MSLTAVGFVRGPASQAKVRQGIERVVPLADRPVGCRWGAVARIITVLALAVVGVAGCAAPPSPTPSKAQATASLASPASSPVATIPLDVRMAGKIACASFPYGCTATVSILPPDAQVPDGWRPPATDPFWVPDYGDGGTTDHFLATPSGVAPVLATGRHLVVVSLLGSYDTPSFHPDGTIATDLLSRCTAVAYVRDGSRALSAVVTFTPNGESFGGTCSIEVAGS